MGLETAWTCGETTRKKMEKKKSLNEKSLNKEMTAHTEYNIYNGMNRRHLEKDSFTLWKALIK